MHLQSENIEELIGALIKVQGSLKSASFDCTAGMGSFSYKYASFGEVISTCRGLLVENDIAVTQASAPIDGKSYIVTQLSHKSGQWMRGYYPVVCKDIDPQKYGSATTYAKRYALSAMVGVVADEDDDGNAASGAQTNTEVVNKGQQGGGSSQSLPVGSSDHLTLINLAATNPNINDDDREKVNSLGERITKWNKPLTEPQTRMLMAICKKLGVSITEEPKPPTQEEPPLQEDYVDENLDDEIPFAWLLPLTAVGFPFLTGGGI